MQVHLNFSADRNQAMYQLWRVKHFVKVIFLSKQKFKIKYNRIWNARSL